MGALARGAARSPSSAPATLLSGSCSPRRRSGRRWRAPRARHAPLPGSQRRGKRRRDGSGQVPTGPDGGGPSAAPRDDLKIVYTGSLQLVVDDLRPRWPRRRRRCSPRAATSARRRSRTTATVRSRPSRTASRPTRWDGRDPDLRGLATKVVAEQTQATEVGGQIVDLEARLNRNLRASEASLQAIAEGAGRISDLLEVEAQLTHVRGQIEQLEGQRAQLEDQVAYGTLVTTFGLEVMQVQEQATGLGPEAGRGRGVRDADRRRPDDRHRPRSGSRSCGCRSSPCSWSSRWWAAGSSGGSCRGRWPPAPIPGWGEGPGGS